MATRPRTRWIVAAVVLVESVSASAQAPASSGRSPLRDAVSRVLVDTVAQTAADTPRWANWSRVAALAEREDVLLTLADALTIRRTVLAADAATVTVLNDAHPALGERARRDLRELARRSPAALVQTLGPGSVRLDDLRINVAGVFLRDVRLGDLSSLVEIHPRDNVAEIRLVEWSRPRPFWRHLFGWPGLLGLTAGMVATDRLCEQGRPRCSHRSIAVGGSAGALAVSAAARHHDGRIPDGVVYRAP